MSQVQDFVYETTYLELSNTTYDAFIEELTRIHAIMQKKAIGDTTDTLTRFEHQIWWYHINKPSLSTINHDNEPVDLWCMLDGPATYNIMINQLCYAHDSQGAMLELTNNLQFIASNGSLQQSAYPMLNVVSLDQYTSEITTVPIFPAFLTIWQAIVVNIIPKLHSSPYIPDPKLAVGHPPLPIFEKRICSYSYPPRPTPHWPLPVLPTIPTGLCPPPLQHVRIRRPDFLVHRRKEDIARRYSVPFGTLVVGLKEAT
ncbi:hypothetical protein H2198_000843 [Neophaeococcomyces mojaviensis]|uniref:Uncharacterized protein n=1 Tax=Neophaeococcomyces mojaviensis TaxID=3383035 RepID=A0ACC3AJ68_9EURO|nr:hypothetical protein H2198_000843 [Knufia sp. JES_112]